MGRLAPLWGKSLAKQPNPFAMVGSRQERPAYSGGGMMHGAGWGIQVNEGVRFSYRRHAASVKRCHAAAVQRGACADDAAVLSARGRAAGAGEPHSSDA